VGHLAYPFLSKRRFVYRRVMEIAHFVRCEYGTAKGAACSTCLIRVRVAMPARVCRPSACASIAGIVSGLPRTAGLCRLCCRSRRTASTERPVLSLATGKLSSEGHSSAIERGVVLLLEWGSLGAYEIQNAGGFTPRAG
jgi:hypothetical protein